MKKIIQKIVWIALITLFIGGMMTEAYAQKSFADAYLKLRQSKAEDEIQIQKFGKKELRKLLAKAKFETQSEMDQQEYLRNKAMMKKVKQLCLILDMEDGLSLIQNNNLLQPYQELAEMKTSDFMMLLSADLKKNKIKELVFFIGDKKDEGMMLATVIFKKSVDLQEYIGKLESFNEFFSINAADEANDHAFFKIKFNTNKTRDSFHPTPDLSKNIPDSIFVVQVDGKYGVHGATAPWKQEYIIRPSFENIPVIFGSNPGNSYIIVSENGYSYLYDKFGFSVASGDVITPVYVLGNENEMAAFIIRSNNNYSLYECPDTYALIQDGNMLRPHFEKRIVNCQSIVTTTDGQLKCVKADNTIEFIPIRKENKS